jgi:hypothetical protein
MPVRIPQITAFSFGDHARTVVAQRFVVTEWMHVMRSITGT